MTSEDTHTTCHSHALERLIEPAFRHLEEVGYAPATCSNYRRVWRRLVKSANGECFSEELVRRFLVEEGFSSNALEDPSGANRNRLQVISALRVLAQYVSQGFVCAHRHSRKLELPDDVLKTLRDYGVHCMEFQRNSRRTAYSKKSTASKFLRFLCNECKESPEELQPSHISGFIESQAHVKPTTMRRNARDLRALLRYFWKTGIVKEDFSDCVPKVRVVKNAHIPTVWRTEDVDAILSVIDRASPKGKRDYAIFLLAARLALRSSDIIGLRLENLCWAESRICLNQSKTGRLLELPLLNEVGEALIDYLRHSRPPTPYRQVFLRSRAPFEPLSSNAALYNIFDFYRRRAGVTLPVHGHQGMHSLRHTLATRLLESETSLETISSVLGHASAEASFTYTKVSISVLRSASLNPDAVLSKEV